jgi:hypothetical protein
MVVTPPRPSAARRTDARVALRDQIIDVLGDPVDLTAGLPHRPLRVVGGFGRSAGGNFRPFRRLLGSVGRGVGSGSLRLGSFSGVVHSATGSDSNQKRCTCKQGDDVS